MGKKAKKTDDVDEEETSVDDEDASEAEAEEESTAKSSSKKKGKAASKNDDDEIEEESDEEETAEKDIFEEKSQVAKQFESTESKEEITEERMYTVPLARGYLMVGPLYRAKRAINEIKKFFLRHMKATELVILPEINEYVWSRGAGHPPRKIKIRATKSIEGTVTLYLAE
ncbi:MAG TPA: 50S ribosomal protein L31e [Candidatus Lokiarchaeia archaeon]|nr:50S ribosomal protein L31e [Candidatus Lokiarchaeia archaeon]